MTTPWDRLGLGPWHETDEVPRTAPDEPTRARLGLPATLRPVSGAGVVQRPVFDPSLAHHAKAMRAGEPRFDDERLGARWYAARRAAVDHVLAGVSSSAWADDVVLRGSVLIRTCFGDAAREPGDLDFVVVPASWGMREFRTVRLLDGIARAAERVSRSAGGVRIRSDGAVSEDIWTYDRVPGRRLLLPWRAGRAASGAVQLDFVFNEELPVAPEPVMVARSDGGEPVPLRAATMELSLAWKVLWLLTDAYPQGKDLYDAVLLAESTGLRASLLREVLATHATHLAGDGVTAERILRLDVDWREFRKDHPAVPRRPDDHVRRLATALAPTFADLPGAREW